MIKLVAALAVSIALAGCCKGQSCVIPPSNNIPLTTTTR
jgi:hypothetical protein